MYDRGVSSCSSLGWPAEWPHLNWGAGARILDNVIYAWMIDWLCSVLRPLQHSIGYEWGNLTPATQTAMPCCEYSSYVTLLPRNQFCKGGGGAEVARPPPGHPLEPTLVYEMAARTCQSFTSKIHFNTVITENDFCRRPLWSQLQNHSEVKTYFRKGCSVPFWVHTTLGLPYSSPFSTLLASHFWPSSLCWAQAPKLEILATPLSIII